MSFCAFRVEMLKISSKMSTRWLQDGPSWPQDGPKSAPRAPKMAPRWPNMSPRGAQDELKRGPKRLQIGLPRLSNIEAKKGSA